MLSSGCTHCSLIVFPTFRSTVVLKQTPHTWYGCLSPLGHVWCVIYMSVCPRLLARSQNTPCFPPVQDGPLVKPFLAICVQLLIAELCHASWMSGSHLLEISYMGSFFRPHVIHASSIGISQKLPGEIPRSSVSKMSVSVISVFSKPRE